MVNQVELSVAVIIPTLNEEQYIGRCLESLAQLDYSKDQIQIYIVDNGSSDQTVKIASSFNVNIINAAKKTIAYSRNIGAFNTKSDLIAFLDADCLPAPWWIKEAVSHFFSTNVVAVGSYPSVLESESNELQKTWANLCRRSNKEIRNVDWLPSANFIVKSKIFRLIDGFNDLLATCEDVDLGYRLKDYGEIIYDPKILVYHLREPKTFMEFFKKEIWHAKNNLSGAFSHGLKASEIPSLVAPLLFGIGLVMSFFGLFFSSHILISCFLFSIIILVMYTIRGYIKTGSFVMVLMIYSVYFLARSFSTFRELLFVSILLKNSKN